MWGESHSVYPDPATERRKIRSDVPLPSNCAIIWSWRIYCSYNNTLVKSSPGSRRLDGTTCWRHKSCVIVRQNWFKAFIWDLKTCGPHGRVSNSQYRSRCWLGGEANPFTAKRGVLGSRIWLPRSELFLSTSRDFDLILILLPTLRCLGMMSLNDALFFFR